MIIYRDVYVCVLRQKATLTVSGMGQGIEYSQISEAENTKLIINMKKLRLSLSNLQQVTDMGPNPCCFNCALKPGTRPSICEIQKEAQHVSSLDLVTLNANCNVVSGNKSKVLREHNIKKKTNYAC